MAETRYVGAGDDVIMWVGTSYYPTIASFVEEAKRLGCCKRLPSPPYHPRLTPGKTRVFLAHDGGRKGRGLIFGYFVVQRLELVVGDLQGAVRLQMAGRVLDLSLVPASVAAQEPPRGCGRRKDGGLYAVCPAGEPEEKPGRQAPEPGPSRQAQGGLVVFDTPLSYNLTVEAKAVRFRGVRKVNGDLLLDLLREGTAAVKAGAAKVKARPATVKVRAAGDAENAPAARPAASSARV